MATQDAKAAAIWRQTEIPVVYRRGGKTQLMVRLPDVMEDVTWLKADNRRIPTWNLKYKCWETPNAWFEDVIRRLLKRFGRVYVIQPYKVLEKCAPACWNAKGFECECSCMGENHGFDAPGKWYVISETCALQWHTVVACRLIQVPPLGVVPNKS